MYHTILVPLDGSALAEQALPLALGLARRAGATLDGERRRQDPAGRRRTGAAGATGQPGRGRV